MLRPPPDDNKLYFPCKHTCMESFILIKVEASLFFSPILLLQNSNSSKTDKCVKTNVKITYLRFFTQEQHAIAKKGQLHGLDHGRIPKALDTMPNTCRQTAKKAEEGELNVLPSTSLLGCTEQQSNSWFGALGESLYFSICKPVLGPDQRLIITQRNKVCIFTCSLQLAKNFPSLVLQFCWCHLH